MDRQIDRDRDIEGLLVWGKLFPSWCCQATVVSDYFSLAHVFAPHLYRVQSTLHVCCLTRAVNFSPECMRWRASPPGPLHESILNQHWANQWGNKMCEFDSSRCVRDRSRINVRTTVFVCCLTTSGWSFVTRSWMAFTRIVMADRINTTPRITHALKTHTHTCMRTPKASMMFIKWR